MKKIIYVKCDRCGAMFALQEKKSPDYFGDNVLISTSAYLESSEHSEILNTNLSAIRLLYDKIVEENIRYICPSCTESFTEWWAGSLKEEMEYEDKNRM